MAPTCTFLLVAAALFCAACSASAQSPPEIVSDGSSITFSVPDNEGLGGLFKMGADGQKTRIATETDVADLGLLIEDGVAQAKTAAKADLAAQVKILMDAHVALATKQSVTEAKLDKALKSLKEYELAAATASDANAKTATCQKSLVDAVHSTSTELKDCPDPTDPSAGGCGEYAAVSNGETHGHGTRKGAVRVLECNSGYELKLSTASGMVVCNSDGKWSDDKQSRCDATTSTSTTVTTTTSTTTTYMPWVLVYQQKNCKMPEDGRLGKDVGAKSADNCFSRLSTIKNFKVDGKFTFKLRYPDARHKNEIVWSQTSDPNLAPRDTVVGYQEITVDSRAPWDHRHGGSAFSGMARSSAPNVAYMDGERKGYWMAIGHEAKSFPGMPYAHSKGARCDGKWDTCEVELWIKNKGN